MVLSLMGTSCLSAGPALTPAQLNSLPVTNHRWSAPTIIQPKATVPSRAVFQPRSARLNTELMRVSAPVRRQNSAPVFAPGRSTLLSVKKSGLQITR